MNREFNADTCKVKHIEVERRLGVHDEDISNLKDRREKDLERIHSKIEEQTLVWAEKARVAESKPGWFTTTLISFLLSIIVACITYIFFTPHGK